MHLQILNINVASDISLQLIYSGYTCTQGWFFTPCMSDPTLRLAFLHSKVVTSSFYVSCHLVFFIIIIILNGGGGVVIIIILNGVIIFKYIHCI